MGFTGTYFALITCCFALKVAQSLGELVVLRHSPTDNGTARKLTCLSEDDGAALIWNYDPNERDVRDGEDLFTNFQPKISTSKNFADCAIWNLTKCLALWGGNSGWDVVDSALVPMGPVFDYRWEGLKEIVLKEYKKYQYVGKVREASGTAVFSIRGLRDFRIFLCEKEDPQTGPCFSIIIAGWRGKRSAIRSCVNRAPEDRLSTEGKDCVDVASVVHGGEDVDAYAWHTFRLEWNSERRTIEVFNETEVEPFLAGTVDQWRPVSHLSIRSESSSRVRFHFYEYFLTKNNNAVISTTEFIHHDDKFCVEVLVGLCPECKLTFTLVDSDDGDTPIATISGEENYAYNKLLTWRWVRLNATLLNLKSRPVKLKLVTGLMKNGVEGLWAIDNFRTCKSVVGLRESAITTHRERLVFTIPFWPTVKCQKLSHTGNTVVDSVSGNHLFQATPNENRFAVDIRQGFETDRDRAVDDLYSVPVPNTAANETKNVGTPIFPSGRSKVMPRTKHDVHVSGESGGLLVNRKARDAPGFLMPLNVSLELYEADPTSNTISVRLSPLHPADGGIEMYTVSVLDGQTQLDKKPYKNLDTLECTLWDNSVCFEKIKLPDGIELTDLKSYDYKLQVTGEKGGEKLVNNFTKLELRFIDKLSSEPTNLRWTSRTHGIVTLTWGHPLLPKTKIRQFQLQIRQLETKLLHHFDKNIIERKIDVDQDKEEYTLDLQLLTSTQYDINVFALNQKSSSRPATVGFWVPGGFDFEAGAELQVKNDGTNVNLTVPTLVNVTADNRIKVILKGPFTCLKNQLAKINWMYKAVVQDGKPTNLKFDANDTRVTMSDCYLNYGETYEIKIIMIDTSSNLTATLPAKSIDIPTIDGKILSSTMKNNLGPSLKWLPIPLIIVFFGLVFLLGYCFRKSRKAPQTSDKSDFLMKSTENSTTTPPLKNSPPPLDAPKSRYSTQQSPPDVVPCNPNSNASKIDDFEEYVKEGLASGLLDSQYQSFPRGMTRSCDYGRLPENVKKNRYTNLIAYDDTRVILKKILDDPYSDYINANWIPGYGNKKAYIATQGPKRNTVKDFWRMIWQENVSVICMLANVKEGGRVKCEKYWPEVEGKLKYGDILVKNTGHQVFADYTIRTFTLGCQKSHREVTHLHYTGWPDHGVPTYTQSLVSYLKKLQDIKTGNGPVVVHCSAGVGRSGTIILCDICRRQAVMEHTIDVPTVTAMIRESRPNMVDTAQQYMLAHLTIVESMLPAPTQIPCKSDLEERLNELRKHLPSNIERLNDTVWQDRALHSLAAPERPSPEDVANNGISDTEIDSSSAAELEPSFAIDSKDNSINAVCVDGVKMKNQYLAAELPSSSTLPEFWKLIAEKRIELVVILQPPEANDPVYCNIMTEDTIFVPVPHIQVEMKQVPIKEDHFTLIKLFLTDTSTEHVKPQPVTVVTCNSWGYREKRRPPAAAALVALWRASEKISRKESPTLVLCRDGVTGCGLYLALSFLLERMSVERECDIISAVRAVRRSKPTFVRSQNQFEYLYDAAIDYIKYFETYSNFS